jgi:DNA modification methylase
LSTPEPLSIRYRLVASLIPYARNARTHSKEQVAQIVASIQEFGWTNPILVDEDGGIVAGHGRVMAAEALGLVEVPTIELRGLTEAQRRAYVIADNKLALNAGWDEAMLAEELSALRDEGFALELTGFSDDELEALLTGEGTEDPEPGLGGDAGAGMVPVSVRGDTWLLGPHRLRCGDSTDQADVALLMDGGEADCLWTDPPYNVDYEGEAGKIMNDAMSPAEFDAFLRGAFDAAIAVMKPGAPAYVAHADSVGVQFRQQFAAAGFYFSGCLIWAKNSLVLGRLDYQMRHEPILYGWKPGAAHQWFGGRKQTSVLELEEPPVTQSGPDEFQVNLGEETLVIRGQGVTVERVVGSVLLEDKPARNNIHPTMKPVPLVERMVRNSTRRGEVVLDLFGGGGSTLIACHQAGRRARLMELDPRFVDAIVKRWQELSGQSAILEGDGDTFEEIAERRSIDVGEVSEAA